ncbi:MAG: thioesterase family protein [Rhodospirillaceae bacterium]
MNADTPIDLKDRSTFRNWTTATIRYSDLDPNGHVNNGAINAFLEDGRVHFRDANMVSLGNDILTGFAVVKFSVEYHSLLFYPGSVDIGTNVIRVGGSSYTLGQAVFDGDRCIASAEVVTVFIDLETNKSQPLSDDLRKILTGEIPV